MDIFNEPPISQEVKLQLAALLLEGLTGPETELTDAEWAVLRCEALACLQSKGRHLN